MSARKEVGMTRRNLADHTAERAVARTVVDRRTWSPAQLVAGALGLFLLVLGTVAILRTGADSLIGETSVVLGIEHTTLMGIIDIVAGVLFLAAAGTAAASRSGLMVVGLLALAFGLILAIEPTALQPSLGASQEIGWLYGAVGIISLIGAWASPTIHHRRTATARAIDSDEAIADY
jgi:hypothetical protein